MATSTAQALAIGVADPVQEDRASDRTQFAHGHSTATPQKRASRKELVTAGEEKHEQVNASEAQRPERWRAFDRLLRTSFGTISPAYLFDSYLDIP
jgi:hypothetical protein